MPYVSIDALVLRYYRKYTHLYRLLYLYSLSS